MAKSILFDQDAMTKMLAGLNKAADSVGGTMGPKGLNAYLDDAYQPKITNDGSTVAAHVLLEDKFEDAGAYVIRNVTAEQNEDVGDGTTTVAVLTQAIIKECLKRPENQMEIKKSLKEASVKILESLSKKSIPLKKGDIEKVALISSEDPKIASLITEIMDKLGKDAVVNVEDSKTFETEYEIIEGYEANVGFMSPHFITDKKTNRAVYENIPVLVVAKKIASISDIAPIFEMFKTENIGSCVIVCDDIDDSMLGILVQNNVMGTFKSLVIKASAWLLEDIEGAVGAKAISDSTGVTFKNFTKEQLGFAKKIVSDAHKTVIATDGVASGQYASLLEMQAENEPNSFQSEQFKKRADRMRGGIAVLKIGASTDFERDYLRLKAEDSVKAVQAALAEGIVEGGGMALWRLAQEIDPKTVGEEILKKALTAPLRRIIGNTGKDYTQIITEMPEGLGYDAKAGVYANLEEVGIIDPSKVERCALENSISAASTFVTTFCCIVATPEEKIS